MVELPVDDPAGKAALLTITAAAIWKIYLRLKSDNRTDKAESRVHEAEGDLIETLREEVERLGNAVRELSLDLNAERKARWHAESRISILESQIRSLGHVPKE